MGEFPCGVRRKDGSGVCAGIARCEGAVGRGDTCKCDELVSSAEAFLAPELGGLPMYNAVCAFPEQPR